MLDANSVLWMTGCIVPEAGAEATVHQVIHRVEGIIFWTVAQKGVT